MGATYTAEPWAAPFLVNVTASAGVGAELSLLNESQVLAEKSAGFLNGGRGACVLDYNGDGDDDIFVVGPGSDQLFRNDGNLQFTDVTASARLGDTGYGMGCASADMDNDGDADIIATNYRSYFDLLRNNGDGTFTNMSNFSGAATVGPHAGVAIADFDNDGLLDFYIAEYLRETDRVYRNLGGWKFEDRTTKAHITDLDHSFQPIAADYDGDGDQDVYVAVDFGPDTLWLNTGDFTFADVSRKTGAFDLRGGMGAAWGDWNADGDLDVFVTNYDWDGLWDNRDGSFVDVANATGTDDIWTGWGVVWIDFDLDGDVDLYIANGVVDYGTAHDQPNKLFRNNGNGQFTDVSENSGGEIPDVTRGLATGDFDNDGRMDLYLLNINCPAMLLHNQLPTTNGYLGVRLQGSVSNRDGVGAEISVRVGSTWTKQLVAAGSSYLSGNSLRLVFGTGNASVVPEIIVKWPSGLRQTILGAAANTTITIVETDSEDPVARAIDVTADQGTPFVLNGSRSTDNVRVGSWKWQVNVSGVLQNATGERATMTIYAPGSFVATLLVTDVFGRTDVASFTVVIWPLVRVTVDAGPDLFVSEGTVVQFQASGGSTATPDYEGDCTFLWTFNDTVGPQLLLGPRPSYSFGRPGMHVVTVSVRDPQNASAQDTVTVTVLDAIAPVIRAVVPTAVDEDHFTVLDATGTTDNDPTFPGSARFAWSYASQAGPVEWEGARITVKFEDPGLIALILTVADATGNLASATYLISVHDSTPPAPNAGPDLQALPGQEVVLSAAGSTDNDPEFIKLGRFEWTITMREGATTLRAVREIVMFAYPGVFKVELDAWDATGNHASAPDVMYVRVLDSTRPLAQGGGDRSVEVGERVDFNAAGTSDDDPALFETGTFVWEFQDGAERKALPGPEASYTFERAGNFTVRLTVTDAGGNSGTSIFKVNVFDAAPPDLIVAPIPEAIGSGIAVVLDATGTTDNGGDVRVQWRVEGPGSFLWQLAATRGEVVLTTPGTYTITVTAKDTAGNAVQQTFTVTVARPAGGGGPGTGPSTGPGTGGGDTQGGATGPSGTGTPAGVGGGQGISLAGLAAAGSVIALAWFVLRRVQK